MGRTTKKYFAGIALAGVALVGVASLIGWFQEEEDEADSGDHVAVCAVHGLAKKKTSGTTRGEKVQEENEATSLKLEPFLKRMRQAVVLQDKIVLSHDTRIFRFALPNPEMSLGLPTGKHVRFFCPNPHKRAKEGEWNGRPDTEKKEEIMRKYTPSSLNSELGSFEVVVKVYKAAEHPQYRDGGKMSQYLEHLEIGDTIDVDGPWGHIEYCGQGNFKLGKRTAHFKHIGLIAGGSGITPMLQLIKTTLNDPHDDTKISLIFANRTEKDILLHTFLNNLAETHSKQFQIFYTLTDPPPRWVHFIGHIDKPMVQQTLPEPGPDTAIFMCGPPAMIDSGKQILSDLCYSKSQIIIF